MPKMQTLSRERQSETAELGCELGNPEEERISLDRGISKGVSEEVAFGLGGEGKGMKCKGHGGIKGSEV